MAGSVANGAQDKKWEGGTLLYAGGTDWARLGRSGGKPAKGKTKAKAQEEEEDRLEMYPNLMLPTRLRALTGVKVMFVSAGPAAVHCLAGDVNGNLYTWGRNEKGQLGHGDLLNRNNPVVVEALKGHFVVAASGGRHHTLAVTREGEAWSFGLNQQGQLGVGSIKKSTAKGFEDIRMTPEKTSLTGVTACSSGIDFSMWIADGKLYSAGSPQYGQLGDGSDHAYNAKDSSISIVFEPQPTPKKLPSLADKTITRVACGHNHSICVDDAGNCYTWGFGGYGRLGHRVQKDEFEPKKVEEFKGRITVPSDALLAAGSTATFTTANIGGAYTQLYCWGKLKTAGDNQMYPIPDSNMQGWAVRSVACGPQHFAIAADQSAITWGFATNGELAYGPDGKKSSANAAKVEALEGVHTHSVAAGVGFTMFLVAPDAAQVSELPEWESTAPDTARKDEPKEDAESEGEAPKAKGGKRGAGKAAAAAAPATKKAKKK